MTKEIRLTTFDNPFDPFDDFANWLLFDNQHGYFTVNKLDRLSNYTEDMTDEEMSIEHDRVVDEIITNDIFNIYKKVEREDDVNDESALAYIISQ